MATARAATGRTPMRTTLRGSEIATTASCRELADLGDDRIVFARLNETAEMLDLSGHLAGGH